MLANSSSWMVFAHNLRKSVGIPSVQVAYLVERFLMAYWPPVALLVSQGLRSVGFGSLIPQAVHCPRSGIVHQRPWVTRAPPNIAPSRRAYRPSFYLLVEQHCPIYHELRYGCPLLYIFVHLKELLGAFVPILEPLCYHRMVLSFQQVYGEFVKCSFCLFKDPCGLLVPGLCC